MWEACVLVLCTPTGAQGILCLTKQAEEKPYYPIDQLIGTFFSDRAQAVFGHVVEG